MLLSRQTNCLSYDDNDIIFLTVACITFVIYMQVSHSNNANMPMFTGLLSAMSVILV